MQQAYILEKHGSAPCHSQCSCEASCPPHKGSSRAPRLLGLPLRSVIDLNLANLCSHTVRPYGRTWAWSCWNSSSSAVLSASVCAATSCEACSSASSLHTSCSLDNFKICLVGKMIK